VNVTTGGISVGVGALIVGTLSVAGVLTVRDENNNSDPTDSAECQPQPHRVAVAARDALLDEYAAAVVVPSDQAGEILGEGKKTGRVAEPLPEWSDDGFVVVVDHVPAVNDPDPPSCYDETPILYMESGPRVTG
jgi:hypothetical protein